MYTPTLTEAAVQLTVEAPEKAAALRVRLCNSAGEMLVSRQLPRQNRRNAALRCLMLHRGTPSIRISTAA